MPKPIVNLNDVEFTDIEDNGYYTSRHAQFSAGIGARRLGYNLTALPPGPASIRIQTKLSSAPKNKARRAFGKCSEQRPTSSTPTVKARSLGNRAPDPAIGRTPYGMRRTPPTAAHVQR